VMHPHPGFKNVIKWYIISTLLSKIRLINVVTTSERKEAFTEYLGRSVGLLSLFITKPK